ncbi:MAG: adenylate kinase [Archaeoglobi archaeon]|nr:adenylate kinase [Candidatus Mnemosynella bozhongmuii]MDI3502596.1 adenylate kinase [Archaeoglobi archaeon]MDK2780997.1 adenylate kinase [Archaeoglobi archaeon]
MSVIVVTGIPGVGSTSVVKKALEKSDFKYVNYGDVMFEIASERGLVSHRDEIRKLPEKIQREIQKEAAERISSMSGRVVVDTHCTVKTPKGYLPGLPKWVLDALSPRQIILVEAHPEEILRRRASDKSRKRELVSPEEIAEHQELNRKIVMAYSALSGAIVTIISNHDNALDEAAEKFLNSLVEE